MYSNNYVLENLAKQRERIDDLMRNYQQPQPVNNFINANQPIQKDLIEWRILNENEEVDNLYVANKTLFINDNTMILKGVDGSLEKWNIVKTYPIDPKDEKIKELNKKLEELERRLNDECSKSNEPVREVNKSFSNDDGYVEPKPKTNSKQFSK